MHIYVNFVTGLYSSQIRGWRALEDLFLGPGLPEEPGRTPV